jgi:hypothetical protein
MHFNICEMIQYVRHIIEFRPIKLYILASGEMAITAIKLIGYESEFSELTRIQGTVWNSDSQHVCVKLEIQAIHKPQRPKLFLREFTLDAPLDLTAKLSNPLTHE